MKAGDGGRGGSFRGDTVEDTISNSLFNRKVCTLYCHFQVQCSASSFMYYMHSTCLERWIFTIAGNKYNTVQYLVTFKIMYSMYWCILCMFTVCTIPVWLSWCWWGGWCFLLMELKWLLQLIKSMRTAVWLRLCSSPHIRTATEQKMLCEAAEYLSPHFSLTVLFLMPYCCKKYT